MAYTKGGKERAEERTPLLEAPTSSQISNDRFRFGRTFWRCASLALILIVGSIAAIMLFVYSPCTFKKCTAIKIMSMNTWGMPAAFGSQFKSERMEAIGKEVQKGHFDIYMLQELWMEADHNTIASYLPQNYSMTGFRQLSSASCDGRVLITWCSGLAIISRYPFKEVEFNPFSDHGDAAKMFVDGEVFVRKGVGRVQVEPTSDLTVDIFTTHTIAEPEAYHGYSNSFYRKKQVRELMEQRIAHSQADLVVLGGDFNVGPDKQKGSSFEMVRSQMQDCVEELFHKLKRWLDPTYSTFGNPSNTFSGGKYEPVMYDFIFRRNNVPEKVTAWTFWFNLPLFKAHIFHPVLLGDSEATENKIINQEEPFAAFRNINDTNIKSNTEQTVKPTLIYKKDDKINHTAAVGVEEQQRLSISFSDHEAITSTIYIRA